MSTTYRVVGCPVVLPAGDELVRGAEFSDDGRDPRLASLVVFWRSIGAVVVVAAPAATAAAPEIIDEAHGHTTSALAEALQSDTDRDLTDGEE